MEPIYQTKHFIVMSLEKPWVDYEDWWHVIIQMKDEFKDKIPDRTKLNPQQAIEFIRLSMVVWEALEEVMNQMGIPVIKINYQEMWNWHAKKPGEKPFLHEHIFWRSKNAKKQPRPEAVYLPAKETWFYEGFRPLPDSRMGLMRNKIEKIFEQKKYKDENRSL